MRRALLGAALALAVGGTLFTSAPGLADSYCFRSGLTIGGEPWLAHEECVDCPVEDCPPVLYVPDSPEDDDTPVWVEITRRA